MTTVDKVHELARVRSIVDRITYRPNYHFRTDIDVSDRDGRVFVQIRHLRPDAVTGTLAWGSGGKSYLSPHMTPSEIVRRCFASALAYEEHEVREFFRYAPPGRSSLAVFGPHIDVDALWEVAARLDVRP